MSVQRFTDEQLTADLSAKLTGAEIARKYGVSEAAVSKRKAALVVAEVNPDDDEAADDADLLHLERQRGRADVLAEGASPAEGATGDGNAVEPSGVASLLGVDADGDGRPSEGPAGDPEGAQSGAVGLAVAPGGSEAGCAAGEVNPYAGRRATRRTVTTATAPEEISVERCAAALTNDGPGIHIAVEVPACAAPGVYGPEEEALSAVVDAREADLEKLQTEYAAVRRAIEGETDGIKLLALQRRCQELPLLVLCAEHELVKAKVTLTETQVLRLNVVKRDFRTGPALREAEEALKAATLNLLRVRRTWERAGSGLAVVSERLRTLQRRQYELAESLKQAATGGGRFTRNTKL